jgi:hypothetical protein
MAVSGLPSCDFVTYTNKGILIVQIEFNYKFWKGILATVSSFYENQILPVLLLQMSNTRASQSPSSLQNANINGFQDNDKESNHSKHEDLEINDQSGINIDEDLDKSIHIEHVPIQDSPPLECKDGFTIDPSKLKAFMNSDDTIKKLEHFVNNGCANPRQFSVFNVTTETIKTLSKLDDDLQSEIMEQLCLLFPKLKKGFNVSKGLSTVHELIKMFMESVE